jgi:hypothetical protein
MDGKSSISYVGMKILSRLIKDRSCMMILEGCKLETEPRSDCIVEIVAALKNWNIGNDYRSLNFVMDSLDFCISKQSDQILSSALSDESFLDRIKEILSNCISPQEDEEQVGK